MQFYFSLPSREGFKKFLVSLFLLANIAGIVWLWQTGSAYYLANPADGNLYIALGRITGLLGEFALLMQLVLVGRVRLLERLYGFDRLNIVHRWTGYAVLSLLVSHPVLLVMGYARANGVGLLSQFADFLANKEDVFAAYFALLLFIFVVFLSVAIVRKKLRYETWYFAHLATYLAVGLALGHQLGTGDLRSGAPLYYWYALNFSAFGLLLLYRWLRPLYRFWIHRFAIAQVLQETPDTWSLYVTGRHMDRFMFEAGQYANITLLARGLWHTHPFSFSAAYNGEYVRFSVKALGDYTSAVHAVLPGTHLVIDGPLGLFVERRAIRAKYLLIAGGIGITPLRAMLESLVRQGKDVVLLYGCRTERDIAFRKEFDDLKQRLPSIGIHYVLGEAAPGYESGRIDKEKIIRLVPDFFLRDAFVCGPPPMMQGVVGHLKELGFADENVHFEKFSF